MADAVKEKTPAVETWLARIAAYDREFAKWEKRVVRLLKKYRDDDRESKNSAAKFNILWSNVQTLLPATFARIPKSDVSRRFRDDDPAGRVAALLLERATEFEIEHYKDFAVTMKACVLDRFLGGRGSAWARYEPHIRAAKMRTPVEGAQVTDKVDEPGEELDYECAPVDYVHWKDFGHSIARTWDEVTAVWRRVYMTRAACMERFGEKLGQQIPLDSTPEDLKKGEMGGNPESTSRALVYEIWDKETKEAIWIAKSMAEELDRKPDPLGLDDFFPCPKPLYATLTNESLVPIPDFALYQDQAQLLDILADRMKGLIEALQIKGVYDASQGAELARIFTEGQNGVLIPMKNWAAFAEKNGLQGAIDVVELKPIYEALTACYEAMQQELKQIYDLTGLSDIVRGQSEASETATAQRIKGQYASLRLKSMQGEVARFASEIIQLKAQIICAKFDPETILKMSAAAQLSPENQEHIGDAMEILVGADRLEAPDAAPGPNPMRAFRIEVNADSMVQIDEQEDKENRMEFLKAEGEFMEKALPLAQEVPELLPLIGSLWKFSVQGFKVGKEIEGQFDAAIDKMTAVAQQPRPPKQDPAIVQAQMQSQTEQMRAQMQQQIEQAKGEREMQALQAKNQLEQQKLGMEQQAAERDAMREMELEKFKAGIQQQIEQQKLELERYKIDADNKTKIDVAEVAAQATIDKAQADAAAAAEQDENTELTDTGAQAASATRKTKKRASAIDKIGEMHQQVMDMHGQTLQAVTKLAEAVVKPRTVNRGPDGRIAGLQ